MKQGHNTMDSRTWREVEELQSSLAHRLKESPPCNIILDFKMYLFLYQTIFSFSSLCFLKDIRGQFVQITKIRYLCFDLVHSRYTRVAGTFCPDVISM